MPRAEFRAAAIAALTAAAAVTARERRRRVAAEMALRAQEAQQRTLERRTRDLQHAWEVRSGWLAGLAHELRTPLAAMISYSELIADDPLPEARREHAACSRSSGDHLLELLDELRDLSALDAGALRLVPRTVDPVQIAAECLRLLDGEARGRSVRLCFQPSTSGAALIDPKRLRQILINFLSNAIRFTEPGGTVTLGLRRVESRLQVSVSDTGRGIASRDQPRVFDERFQAVDSAGGSGLGLAIVKRLVEAQGGEVAVTSRPRLGSTFYAWLPWIPAAEEVDPARPTVLTHAVR